MISALANLARKALALPLASLAPTARPTIPGAEGHGQFARLLRAGPGSAPRACPGDPGRRGDMRREREELPATSGPGAPWGGSAASSPRPPIPAGSPEAATAQERGALALQELWPALVRKVAWEGDARRASMRLELGAGALAGAVLLLHCDEGRVHVQLTGPGGVDLDAWRARIAARLVASGLRLEGVD